MSPICHFSENSCRKNCAHVIRTAETDSSPTDANQLLEDCELLEDYGLVEYHSNRDNDLSVHARIDSTGSVRLMWESSEEDDKNTNAVIFEVKFGERQKKRSQIHASEP